jgi:hypothetical protein
MLQATRLFGLVLILSASTQTPALQGGSPQTAPAITITLTEVPPAAPGGATSVAEIAGTVRAAPNDARIVILAHGDMWYVQPYVSAPFTALTAGKFRSVIHLGTEYAVLVVTRSYRPPATTAEPPRTGGEVLAMKVFPGS